MIAIYDLLALGAAACWAASSMLAVVPVRHLGTFAFTRWRMLLVALLLWGVVAATGSWRSLSLDVAGPLVLSGLVGIFVGDTALFGATHRLGPRRTGVLFATHAAFSAVLGFAVLGERMGLQAMLGGALTMAGVMSAIVLGRHKDEQHTWETDHGSLKVGVALGLVAALGQALPSRSCRAMSSVQKDSRWTPLQRPPCVSRWPAPRTSCCCGSACLRPGCTRSPRRGCWPKPPSMAWWAWRWA
jgi:drug/metabolite transporter (DMT)-like permease